MNMRLTDNIDSWSDDKYRLILYADIMGFKDTIFSSTHNELKKSFAVVQEIV